ncbi:MAG: hypothetical protein WBL70_18195 [Candidatus Acidiferrales bacterium]
MTREVLDEIRGTGGTDDAEEALNELPGDGDAAERFESGAGDGLDELPEGGVAGELESDPGNSLAELPGLGEAGEPDGGADEFPEGLIPCPDAAVPC